MPKKWVCELCTFINDFRKKSCDMCGTEPCDIGLERKVVTKKDVSPKGASRREKRKARIDKTKSKVESKSSKSLKRSAVKPKLKAKRGKATLKLSQASQNENEDLYVANEGSQSSLRLSQVDSDSDEVEFLQTFSRSPSLVSEDSMKTILPPRYRAAKTANSKKETMTRSKKRELSKTKLKTKSNHSKRRPISQPALSHSSSITSSLTIVPKTKKRRKEKHLSDTDDSDIDIIDKSPKRKRHQYSLTPSQHHIPFPNGSTNNNSNNSGVSSTTARHSSTSAYKRSKVTNPKGISWIDKHFPTKMDQLPIHKTKLNQLEKFLKKNVLGDGFGEKKANAYRYAPPPIKKKLLLLTGPSGVGKTAALKVICSELNINIVEYSETPPLNIATNNNNNNNFNNDDREASGDDGRRRFYPQYDSAFKQFMKFLNSARKTSSLDIMSGSSPADSFTIGSNMSSANPPSNSPIPPPNKSANSHSHHYSQVSSSSNHSIGNEKLKSKKTIFLIDSLPSIQPNQRPQIHEFFQKYFKDTIQKTQQQQEDHDPVFVFVVSGADVTPKDLDRLFSHEVTNTSLAMELAFNPVTALNLDKFVLRRILSEENFSIKGAKKKALLEGFNGDIRFFLNNLQFSLCHGQQFKGSNSVLEKDSQIEFFHLIGKLLRGKRLYEEKIIKDYSKIRPKPPASQQQMALEVAATNSENCSIEECIEDCRLGYEGELLMRDQFDHLLKHPWVNDDDSDTEMSWLVQNDDKDDNEEEAENDGPIELKTRYKDKIWNSLLWLKRSTSIDHCNSRVPLWQFIERDKLGFEPNQLLGSLHNSSGMVLGGSTDMDLSTLLCSFLQWNIPQHSLCIGDLHESYEMFSTALSLQQHPASRQSMRDGGDVRSSSLIKICYAIIMNTPPATTLRYDYHTTSLRKCYAPWMYFSVIRNRKRNKSIIESVIVKATQSTLDKDLSMAYSIIFLSRDRSTITLPYLAILRRFGSVSSLSGCDPVLKQLSMFGSTSPRLTFTNQNDDMFQWQKPLVDHCEWGINGNNNNSAGGGIQNMWDMFSNEEVDGARMELSDDPISDFDDGW